MPSHELPSLVPTPGERLLKPQAPPGPPAAPKAPSARKPRGFGDAAGTRSNIFDAVLEAAQNVEPVSNQRHTLRLSNVSYSDPDRVSKAEHKRAILEGRTLGRALKGTWELVDNATGSVVDRRNQIIARVPYLTDLGTFVHGGSDYTVNHQQRLKPGIFGRVKENGEVESHVNVLPGKGFAHRYLLDPDKGTFHLVLGQSRLPLMPLLRAAGVNDHQLREAWGPELFAANYGADDPVAIKKLAAKVLRPRDLEGDPDVRRVLADRFASMELDGFVNGRTLGRPHRGLSADAMLDATRKLLAIYRKEADPDDRDHLAYQKVVGPEDLFAERVLKDHSRIRRSLLSRASFRGSLKSVPSGALTAQIEQAILGSGLGQSLEEVNPAEVLDRQTLITRMGEGGLSSPDVIPEDSRAVQPSHLGFIDPLRTPESMRAGVDTFMARGARKNPDGSVSAQFRDVRTGQEVWKTPEEIADAVVAFPGSLKLPYKRVPVMKNGRIAWERKDRVDFEVPRFEDAFSPAANMIPFKSAAKGQRVAMGSRMMTQALPLVEGEAPLVRSGVPGSGGRSFEEEYGGHFGALRSDDGGVVQAVERGRIVVRTDDGRTVEHELYDSHPFNRKSVTADTRIIIHKADGTCWRGTIAEYELVRGEGDRVLTVDPATKVSGWHLVTGFLKHVNDKRLFRVSMRSGRSVVVTEDHSLVSLGAAGELTPLFPADCVPGKTRLPVAHCRGGARCAPRVAPGASEEDLGTLVGLYLSEGHCPPTQPGLVILSVAPDDRAEEVLTLCRRCGVVPYRNGGAVNFTNHALCTWLVENFGHLAHNKRIPDWVYDVFAGFRRGLVRGYMAGDGCLWVDKNGAIQVAGVSVSVDLRDGLVDLLATFDVFTTLFDAPRAYINETWRDAHGFRVTSGHLSRLDRWFFYEDREAEFRRRIAPSYRSSEFAAVPVPPEARKVLYAGFKAVGLSVPRYIHKTALSGAVAKHRLSECEGVFGAWARSDVMWDPVEAVDLVEQQHEYVYDLCVDTAETFAVNGGLVVHNTFIHQTPVVGPGTRVQPGQLLARSNFTDAQGHAALGRNARVAFMPWGGKNYEDALVISESFAKKFTSEHMYQHNLDLDEKSKVGKKHFLALFPGKHEKRWVDAVGDDGVIRPGETVEYGQPLILGVRERDRAHNKVHKPGQSGYSDISVVWDHHSPGVVTDVAHGKDGPLVVVKSQSVMQVGDKMANRYGGKGVVAEVVPDRLMPHDRSGVPFEVLANPLGVISRTNPVQVAEIALAKVAAKTGKPYAVEDFDSISDAMEYARGELQKYGLEDTEPVIDPGSGRVINPAHYERDPATGKRRKVGSGVLTGGQFFFKLHHQAESKGQARASGAYSSDEAPAKGGKTGSKRISLIDTNALLSHGASQVLRDASAVRGQKNDQYWLEFMQGHTPRAPRVPLVYEKFLAQLRGAGVNVVRDGTRLHVYGLTRPDVDELAGDREVASGETVEFDRDLRPVPGGLFDPGATGGHGGTKWSSIRLHEPMLNPVMEEPARRLLGLTQKELEGVISGEHSLPTGTGPEAVRKALADLNIPREIALARSKGRFGSRTERDEANRRLGYLKALQERKLNPADWVLDRVPVLPPVFRPVSVMGSSGTPLVADANWLYKELIEADDNLKAMHAELGPTKVGPERLAVYNAFKAVTGLGDPVGAKTQEKQVKGLLKQIFANSPKMGTVQRKLIGSTVDNVGRGVVVPNPAMDMDHIGLPEDMAFGVYEKFLVRRLVRRGMKVGQALREVRDRTPRAREELVQEMDHRPVIVNRAPVLHKFGILAHRPVLVAGHALHVSPLVVKGYGMDFDGDAVQFHVPTDDAARSEALERMLPSKALLSPADFKTPVHAAGQEYIAGVHAATWPEGVSDKPPRYFRTQDEVRAAYSRGEIDANDRVVVMHG